MRIDDELTPGTTRLIPQSTPQRIKPQKDGGMLVISALSRRWKNKYAREREIAKGVQLLFSPLFFTLLKKLGKSTADQSEK